MPTKCMWCYQNDNKNYLLELCVVMPDHHNFAAPTHPPFYKVKIRPWAMYKYPDIVLWYTHLLYSRPLCSSPPAGKPWPQELREGATGRGNSDPGTLSTPKHAQACPRTCTHTRCREEGAVGVRCVCGGGVDHRKTGMNSHGVNNMERSTWAQ